MDIQAALKTQYHAALAMLKEAIEQCPDELWATDEPDPTYWHSVFHALFFTHLYLMPDEAAFRPWEKDRGHEPAEPYAKDEMLEYWAFCEALVESVDTLDLSAARSGFHWYDPLPKLDHQINNIRHIQHHAAVLSDRLRADRGRGVAWVGMVK